MSLITSAQAVGGMDEATYHADPVQGGSLSYSGMKQLLKSPAHYRHYMDEGHGYTVTRDGNTIRVTGPVA